MKTIPLAAIPNQSLSIRADDTRMVLRIKDTGGCMVVDIERDGVPVITGTRALAGEPLIPYRYKEEGNFIFLTVNDELPDWREFGNTQRLVYLTKAEIDGYH